MKWESTYYSPSFSSFKAEGECVSCKKQITKRSKDAKKVGLTQREALWAKDNTYLSVQVFYKTDLQQQLAVNNQKNMRKSR